MTSPVGPSPTYDGENLRLAYTQQVENVREAKRLQWQKAYLGLVALAATRVPLVSPGIDTTSDTVKTCLEEVPDPGYRPAGPPRRVVLGHEVRVKPAEDPLRPLKCAGPHVKARHDRLRLERDDGKRDVRVLFSYVVHGPRGRVQGRLNPLERRDLERDPVGGEQRRAVAHDGVELMRVELAGQHAPHLDHPAR